MKIIRNNGEKLLLAAVGELLQKKTLWWAVWVALGEHNTRPHDTAFKILSDTASRLSAHGEWALYFLRNDDAVLLTRNISHALCAKTLGEITYLLFEDAAEAQKRCTPYQRETDLIVLHERVRGFSLNASAREAIPDPVKLLNASFFRLSAAGRKGRQRLCVLIVEDQRFSRQIVLEILGKQFERITAGDGAEALRLYEAYAPDIVFLDIDLPALSGHEVLSRIREVDADAFIVMLTASHMQKDVEDSLKRGAMGYIVKPFSRQKIDKYLEMYQRTIALKYA